MFVGTFITYSTQPKEPVLVPVVQAASRPPTPLGCFTAPPSTAYSVSVYHLGLL